MRLTAAVGILAVLPVSSGLRAWQPIRELEKQVQNEPAFFARADAPVGSPVGSPAASASQLYPAYNLTVPVDHFHNDSLYEPHVNDTFQLRYWYDASHYRKGGPVILLASGETSGANRLPFLQKGIAARLARATHGLAVVLEHRYYGTSFPYDNLTTESMRFLRMEQAIADTAYFAKNVQFNVGDGDSDSDTSPSGTPWIIYGGSYAGAFAAFSRILYPDVFWGAISSSGVTVAVYDYWQYYEAHRLYAPRECINLTQQLIHAADQILLAGRREAQEGDDDGGGKNENYDKATGQRFLDRLRSHRSRASHRDGPAATRVAQLKAVFGLGNITYDDDFASVISSGMDPWQDTNWDPAETSPDFGWFCGNLTADTLLYPELEDRRANVQSLLAATTYRESRRQLEEPMLNFIGWVGKSHTCGGQDNRTQDQCFSNRNATFFRQDGLGQRWRSWSYQYCTQWGYLATGSGVPPDRLPLVSRLLDLDYLSIICREAFNVTAPPDVASVNKYGGFGIQYPRLAIIDGEADPWRAATPHAIGDEVPGRVGTTDEPFWLIGGGAVHHWDENGLLDNETTADLPPAPIREVQAAEEDFVVQWVADWADRT